MTVLRIDLRDDADRWGLTVSGELDVETTTDLAIALEEFPADATTVLDLDGLTFMDSSGLRALLHAQLGGRTLILANPRPAILKILDIAEVLDLFPVESVPS